MQELYELLKNYNIDDYIKFEENDEQFLALKSLYNNLEKNKNFFLFYIIANSLICYQLSSTWEKYWKEFSIELWKYLNSWKTDIYNFFQFFLKNSKWNKRLIEIKLKRILKLEKFLNDFIEKQEYYYENMLILRDKLSKVMNQKKDAKTIVFAIKMFSYWARVYFGKIVYFPFDINIPIDSRIEKIFKKYWKNENIKEFYWKISKKLNIPELHLDAVLWIKIKDF